MERRVIDTEIELRETSDGASFAGRAAVYDTWADIGGMFRERIAPGAFDRAIAEGQDVRHLINHDPNLVLGRTTAGTTRISGDGALNVETDLPDTSYARDFAVSSKRGDISQMSFGFQVAEGGDEWDWKANPPERTIRDADIFDVSSVTFPSYNETSGEVRSALEAHGVTAPPAETADVAAAVVDLRAGKVLSQANADALATAIAHHSELGAALDAIASSAAGDDEDDKLGQPTDTQEAELITGYASSALQAEQRRLLSVVAAGIGIPDITAELVEV